ncbi:hypothetical protein LTR66_012524 [Elasticomyces elasticus]|nr:hypothetical protein LTR66_012524 [Elasticomyces elasticus]
MAEGYEMLEELGSGSFGIVYKAKERATGALVAIKHIDLEGSDDDILEIQQEISLLSTCASQYVTQYKTSFVKGTKLWIVMEYLGGGSCLDLLKPGPFTEAHIAIIMRELLFGLDYLHQTGKIHRDIKAANILLSTSGRVKIADFGVAAQLTNIKSQRMTFVGTPFWMAPEVIQEEGYDFKADIWSLGITAMELANGEPPNAQVHPMKVLMQIPKNPPPRLEGGHWSREFREFAAACLVKDPDRRPTAKALLRSRFILKAGKTEVLKELTVRMRRYVGSEEKSRQTRYYEATLHDMSSASDQDEWVFDTVKPTIPHPSLQKHTIKRRKLSRVLSGGADHAVEMLQQLDLNAAPLGNITNSPSPTKSTTIGTSKAPLEPQRRKSSVVTARKASASTPTARRVSNKLAQPNIHEDELASTPTARRVSGAQPKLLLGLDISFGNGTSTVRQFKRVSSDGHKHLSPSQGTPQQSSDRVDHAVDSDAENKPPLPVLVTKEAILGRRAFSKCIDPAFQESYAQTSDNSKREAISKVATAWSQLDELDPEGGLLLFKLMLDKVQQDPKLTAQLLPQKVVNTQLHSLRAGHSPSKRVPVVSEKDVPSNVSSRDITPSTSPSKAVQPSTPQQQTRQQSESPTKLVLNPQNPHLKSLRHKQSMQLEEKKAEDRKLEEKMPGKTKPGMEHVGMLADVLYGRWSEGLRGRWGLA